MNGPELSTLEHQSSFSPETFSYSVARTVEGWRSDFDEVFSTLPQKAHEQVSDPIKVLAVLPANSPAPLMTVTVSAWLRRASLRIKPSRGDFDFAQAWIDFAGRYLKGLDAMILSEVDLSADSAFDSVIVFGSDETVAHFRNAFKNSQTRFIGFGHRYSVGYVERCHSATLPHCKSNAGDVAKWQSDTIAAAARDIVAWDQSGCLSPQTIFVCGNGSSAVDFARLLADELGSLQRDFPRRAIPPATSLAIRAIRMDVSMRDGGTVFGSALGTAWTVLCDTSDSTRMHLEATPLERTVWIKPVSGWQQTRAILESDIGHVEACGIWTASERFDEIVREMSKSSEWGPHRIVRLGEMQSPSLGRFHGGLPPLCLMA